MSTDTIPLSSRAHDALLDDVATVECAATAARSPSDVEWLHRFQTLAALHLPDLAGKTVLCVDAHGGYFARAAERFGARRVLALDDLESVAADTVGQFDVVMLVDVLERIRDQRSALERVAGVTRELLVLQTLATGRSAAIAAMLQDAGFRLVVTYPLRRLSVTHLTGLPGRARSATESLRETPWRARRRYAAELVKSAVARAPFAAHAMR